VWNPRTRQQTLPGTEYRDYDEVVVRLRNRHAFVGYCEGAGCKDAIHYGDDYVHSTSGLYCARCWREVRSEHTNVPPAIWPEWQGKNVPS